MTSLFTVHEVAETLHLHPDSVYARISSGELAAVRLGRGPKAPIRVRADDLDRYVTPPARDTRPRRPLERGPERRQARVSHNELRSGLQERAHSVLRQRPTTYHQMHLLRNGHPAHAFTAEDRRKAAAKTNAIRRARRAAANDEIFERAVAELIARDEARRARKREKERRRREDKKRLAALERPFRYEPTYRDDAAAAAEIGPVGPAAPAEERPRPFDSGRYDWP